MMNRILAYSLFAWVLFVKATIHPYYVSTMEIDYRPNRSALQITIRVFTDDWQLMINTVYDQDLRLDPDSDAAQTVIHSSDYLQKEIELKLNDTEVQPVFLGRDYQNDPIVFYLEVKDVAELKTLAVSNSILFELLEGQQNIVRIKTPTKRKSYLQSQGKVGDVFLGV